MILTDREIEAALSHKQISITPSPKPEAFSSTSVDLTLLNKIRIWKKEAMAGSRFARQIKATITLRSSGS